MTIKRGAAAGGMQVERIRNSRTPKFPVKPNVAGREKQMPGNRCILDAPGVYSGWPGFPITLPRWGRTSHQVEGRRDRRRIAEEKEKGPKWRKKKRKEATRHVSTPCALNAAP